jgi:hypothetical protein
LNRRETSSPVENTLTCHLSLRARDARNLRGASAEENIGNTSLPNNQVRLKPTRKVFGAWTIPVSCRFSCSPINADENGSKLTDIENSRLMRSVPRS